MKALQLFKLGKLPMPRCDLLLSKPRELPTGAFFLSVTKQRRKRSMSKRTSRILAEYYLRIQYIRLWVREPPQVFIFPLLWTCSFTYSRTRCAINSVRGVAGILFKKASRQTKMFCLINLSTTLFLLNLNAATWRSKGSLLSGLCFIVNNILKKVLMFSLFL